MTKKKTRYKSARLNAVIVLLCLFCSAASLGLFYRDINSTSSRADKEQIATISFKRRIAQRKYSDRAIWERLSQNSPLYNGDKIHTADLSQATINCGDGIGIEIFENSMLQIFVDKDKNVRLSVSNGSIEVDTTNSSEDVSVEMGNGSILNMKKGSRASAGVRNGSASFKVMSGGASFGDGTEIGSGESAMVSSGGQLEKSPITVTSVSECQRVLLFDDSWERASGKGAIPIEWTPLSGPDASKKVIVETSTRKDFSVISDSFSVADANRVEIPAGDGAVFWRAYIEGDSGNAAQGKIDFEKIPAVEAKWPEDKEVFSNSEQRAPISLSWSGNEYARRYKVEVSRSADFSTTEITSETESQSIALNSLPEGEYFWRVTPYHEANEIGYRAPSTGKSFSITSKKIQRDEGIPRLPPPELLEPAEGQIIGTSYLEKHRSITFAWSQVPDATDYDFSLFQRTGSDMKEIYSRKNMAETKVRIDNLTILDIASFQWQVAAKAKARNGFVIQTGDMATRDFEISFELPGKIRQLNPGVVYGE